MISLLECIIIQGYYRTVCFRTSYREMLDGHYLPAQRSKDPLWIMSPCSPPWAATWCVSWLFAVAAELQSCTWQSALHPCCTPASATPTRLTVFWCKSAYACICSPHTGGSAGQLNFAKWSEASVSLSLLFAGVRVSVCRSEASEGLSVVLRMSWRSAFQLTRGWNTWAEWQVRPLWRLQAAFIKNKRNWAFER